MEAGGVILSYASRARSLCQRVLHSLFESLQLINAAVVERSDMH